MIMLGEGACKRCVCEVLDACVWIAKVSQEHARELGCCSRRLATLWTRIGSDKFTRSWSKGWIWSKSHCLKKMTNDLKSLTPVAASKLCQWWRQPAWWTSVTRAWPPSRWLPVALRLTAALTTCQRTGLCLVLLMPAAASASFCYTTALRYPDTQSVWRITPPVDHAAASIVFGSSLEKNAQPQNRHSLDEMEMTWIRNGWRTCFDVRSGEVSSMSSNLLILFVKVGRCWHRMWTVAATQSSFLCVNSALCASPLELVFPFSIYLYTLYPYIFISSYIYISLYTLYTWYPYIYIHWYSVNVTISVSRLAGLKGKQQNSQPAK